MKISKKGKIIIGLSIVLVVSIIIVATKKRKKESNLLSDSASGEDSNARKVVVTKGTNVNLRSQPSVNSDVRKTVSDSDTVVGEWLQAAHDTEGTTNPVTGRPYVWHKVFPNASLGVQEAFYIREDLVSIMNS